MPACASKAVSVIFQTYKKLPVIISPLINTVFEMLEKSTTSVFKNNFLQCPSSAGRRNRTFIGEGKLRALVPVDTIRVL